MKFEAAKVFHALLSCCAVALAGCNLSEPSAAELADRSSRSYTEAMSELQAGHVDTAIAKFGDVVRAEPGNGNAHFQLAALLEDKKDFLGAIVHYRLYLMIRPKSDKAAVAQDRMKSCETRYSSMMLEKANVDNKFAADLEKLRKVHEQCGKKAAKLSEELEEARRKIASLEKEVEMKKRMLARASAIADDASVAQTPKQKLRPTDAELLDDDPDGDRVVTSTDIKKLRAMLDEEDRVSPKPKKTNMPSVADADEDDKPPLATTNQAASSSNPFLRKKEKKAPGRIIPETYTVEEGDTLMRISAKFYGTNHKWRAIRDANKTVISPDGRVNAGQVIKLP